MGSLRIRGIVFYQLATLRVAFCCDLVLLVLPFVFVMTEALVFVGALLLFLLTRHESSATAFSCRRAVKCVYRPTTCM